MSNNNYSNEHVSGVSSCIADRSKQHQNHHRFYPTQSAGNERIVVGKKPRDKKQGYIPGLNTGATEITISEDDINKKVNGNVMNLQKFKATQDGHCLFYTKAHFTITTRS